MDAKQKMTLVALFVLFFLLFNAPFLTTPRGFVAGLPKVMLYIGSCWIILIIMMGIISFKKNHKKG